MKRSINALALAWSLLAAAGCGRKGPLELPYSKIPAPVEDLKVTQRGDKAVLEWTNPGKNIDGHPPVDVEAIEIWTISGGLGEPGAPLKPGDVEKSGRMTARISGEELFPSSKSGSGFSPGQVRTVPLEKSQASGGSLAFSVRVQANGSRLSDFATPVAFELRPCALPPGDPAARLSEEFVEILWSPPRTNIDGTAPPVISGYMVYRSEDGRPPRRLTPDPLPDTRFEDRDIRFGSVVRYFVRTSSAAEAPYLESGDSEAVQIVPRDVFPPGPPEGLVGIAGGDSVSLSWKAGPESDLAGYRVWRSEEGKPGEVLLTPDPIAENMFRDTSLGESVLYLYFVSALDRNGNESGRSGPAAVRLKEGGR